LAWVEVLGLGGGSWPGWRFLAWVEVLGLGGGASEKKKIYFKKCEKKSS